MKPLWISLLLSLLVLCPGLARGQSELPALEQRAALLSAHRGRLEARLGSQVKRIGRLKAQPQGVRRDYQLNSALRENRQLTDKLSKLQDQIRALDHRLLQACTRALAASGLDPARREALRRKRDALKRKYAAATPRIAVNGRAGPLDSPEDLEERADLLEDSREKIGRQLVRIERQLTRLRHRQKLRRMGRSADDNPFDESSTGGRARRQNGTPLATADTTTRESANKQGGAGTGTFAGGTPSPPLDSSAPPAGASAPVTPLVTLQDALDPAILGKLDRVGKVRSLKARVAALRRAEKQLKAMDSKLWRQSRDLRSKARTMRRQGRKPGR
jgi:hypothetical protein